MAYGERDLIPSTGSMTPSHTAGERQWSDQGAGRLLPCLHTPGNTEHSPAVLHTPSISTSAPWVRKWQLKSRRTLGCQDHSYI